MKLPISTEAVDKVFKGAYIIPKSIALSRSSQKWVDGLVDRGWCVPSDSDSMEGYVRTKEYVEAELEEIKDFFADLDLSILEDEITFTWGKASISKMAQSHLFFIENMRIDSFSAWAYINNLKTLKAGIEQITKDE
jgi:hypothetical protein